MKNTCIETRIHISEMIYRCVDCKEGYILQSKGMGRAINHEDSDEDWVDVTDLTELKIWEYNELVDGLHKHYPDYPIELLEGRFV